MSEIVLGSHERLAGGMILLGGICGLVIAIVSLMLVPFMASVLGYGYEMMWEYGGIMMGRYGMFGYPQFGLGMMANVMLLWSLLGLTGGLLSIFCGVKLRDNYSKHVIFIGLIGGVFLLIAFFWVPGLLVLAGSLLLYFE